MAKKTAKIKYEPTAAPSYDELLAGLQLAIRALNTVPNFPLTNGKKSYNLLADLDRVMRRALTEPRRPEAYVLYAVKKIRGSTVCDPEFGCETLDELIAEISKDYNVGDALKSIDDDGFVVIEGKTRRITCTYSETTPPTAEDLAKLRK